MTEHKIFTKTFTSPIGEMIVGIYKDECVLLDFLHRKSLSKLMENKANLLKASFVETDHPLSDVIIDQVLEYINGDRKEFDFPIRLVGTDYQKKIWSALQKIAYGKTISYGELANWTESSPRAVGHANGQNTLALVVPCHRVIGADGSLVGYGGGIRTKKKLLQLESEKLGQLPLNQWYAE